MSNTPNVIARAPATLAALAIAAAMLSACASVQGDTSSAPAYASRDCKAVTATFPNRPAKDATPAEQAEARLKLGRLAAARGGSGAIGNSLLPDLDRDCH